MHSKHAVFLAMSLGLVIISQVSATGVQANAQSLANAQTTASHGAPALASVTAQATNTSATTPQAFEPSASIVNTQLNAPAPSFYELQKSTSNQQDATQSASRPDDILVNDLPGNSAQIAKVMKPSSSEQGHEQAQAQSPNTPVQSTMQATTDASSKVGTAGVSTVGVHVASDIGTTDIAGATEAQAQVQVKAQAQGDNEPTLKITGDEVTESEVLAASQKMSDDHKLWELHSSAPELNQIIQKYEADQSAPNQAMRDIVAGAREGNAKDQAALGDMYRTGFEVEQDYAKALYWYGLAATQNDADAQYCISYMYATGLGVEIDYKQARIWSEKAAQQNNSMAEFMLANLYLKGLSVKQDYKQATAWFKKSAQHGNPDAQYGLALIYSNGLGVKTNYQEARKYLKMAREQEHLLSMRLLGSFYFLGKGGPVDEEGAMQLWSEACAKGDQKSCSILNI